MNRKERKVFTGFYFFYSFLAFIIPFSLSSKSVACEVIIKNDTGLTIKIASLTDMCGNIIVNERFPYYLKTSEEICFKNLKPVMHHYSIKINGIGTFSSVGMDSETKTYTIRVIRDGIYIWGITMPNIWPGNNKCNEQFDKILQIWALKFETF